MWRALLPLAENGVQQISTLLDSLDMETRIQRNAQLMALVCLLMAFYIQFDNKPLCLNCYYLFTSGFNDLHNLKVFLN